MDDNNVTPQEPVQEAPQEQPQAAQPQAQAPAQKGSFLDKLLKTLGLK
ncbi:MAG: hypothetical protein WC243_03655 [Patescibacteria group bacterium]|jgi:hypothetical protein